MRVVGVLQARANSSRLPRKCLLPIAGRAMFLRVFDRLALAGRLDSIVVATTHASENRIIQKLCEREGVGCVVYKGADEEVVGRLIEAATATSAEAIVRVTADCPLLDPEIVDLVVSMASGDLDFGIKGWLADYCSNVFPQRTHPDGLDCEWLLTETLFRLHEAEDPTRQIWENPLPFRVRAVAELEDLSDLRWTVDYRDDLEFARWATKRLPEGFGWRDVLALKDEAPRSFLCRFDPVAAREVEAGRRRSY